MAAPRLDYDLFLNGDIWRLDAEDLAGRDLAMTRRKVYEAGYRRGLRVKTQIVDDLLYVQALGAYDTTTRPPRGH